jgi:DNA processing protein
MTVTEIPAGPLRRFSADDVAPLVALSGFDGLGPARLRTLLAHHCPAELWLRLASGPAGLAGPLRAALARQGAGAMWLDRWRLACAQTDPEQVLALCHERGRTLATWDDPLYPHAFLSEPEPPPVVFAQGSLAAAVGVSVAIVGTRRATSTGLDVATELGEDLTASGVAVVSGLARGVDGAAHRGALLAGGPAPPVAVIGTGLDRAYPAQHRRLQSEVAAAGVVLTEAAPGARVEKWRFPARNRLIAALASVVVVVESHRRGGALITAELAEQRNATVAVVPGSVRSPAAEGTNQLLRQPGVVAIRNADDVLELLGLATESGFSVRPTPASADPDQRAVLNELAPGPATLEALAARTGIPLGRLAVAVERLLAADAVQSQHGYLRKRRRRHSIDTRASSITT